MVKNNKHIAYLLFGGLCLIWGSSFVLMKIGLYGTANNKPLLSPWQLAAIRLISASAIMLPIVALQWKKFWNDQKKWLMVATGLIGTFIPAILFCLAETEITSALAGTLNAITPLFTILIGVLVFGRKAKNNQWLGILIGMAGCILLLAAKGIGEGNNFQYSLLVIAATICYGINTNIAKEKFAQMPALHLSAFALASMFIPSLFVGYFSGLFSISFSQKDMGYALLSGVLLGMVGTALATILFYSLVKKAGPVFASMVTYGIPIVALAWGAIYGETISAWQIATLTIILSGVFLATRSK